MTIYDFPAEHAHHRPAAPALPGTGGEPATNAGLPDRIQQTSASLSAAGIGRADRCQNEPAPISDFNSGVYRQARSPADHTFTCLAAQERLLSIILDSCPRTERRPA